MYEITFEINIYIFYLLQHCLNLVILFNVGDSTLILPHLNNVELWLFIFHLFSALKYRCLSDGDNSQLIKYTLIKKIAGFF